MKVALITSCKISKIDQYVPYNCTEILTNNPNLADLSTTIPIIYEPNVDEVIKNVDYVIALCSRKRKTLPPITSKCKRYQKSFDFLFID